MTLGLRIARFRAVFRPGDRRNGGVAEHTGDMMNADRTVLTDAMWARTGDMLPGRKPDPGGTAADSRLLVEAVPVRFRTGSPWRGLPKRSARWRGVSRRFRRRVLSGVPERVFNALSGDSGPERVSVDGTAVQAPRKAAGARKRGAGIREPGVPGVA